MVWPSTVAEVARIRQIVSQIVGQIVRQDAREIVGAIGPDWGDRKRGAQYEELLKPEGPIVFAGEHLSYVGLWQEGSALSAHEALKLLNAMAAEKAGKAAAA